MKCPYCSAGPTQGRSTTTPTGRSITDCSSCGRVLSEQQTQTHHLFHLRAQDSPLLLSTSDLPSPPPPHPTSPSSSDDPFEHTGFITAFSTWSLEHCPLFALSSLSFAGHLAELERAMEVTGSGSGGVVVDNLRAYLQVVDVGSILRLERDVMDHAFQLFRECSSATFLRNRSVEALATACLVQAIREAQEPRTLQEISIAANLPQKEIGKYIKILGEALQLSQPINSNSITVHMPRFCNLLQLNKSAQELATHIGEVVMNKCFCTRRNPISISAAAIYLACQLEDRRKTQAEICKVTGLTEVTLRKVYKELLENWDDLLPSNYTPVVPPEKAFPTTTIASGRSAGPRSELPETAVLDREKQPPETKPLKSHQPLETSHQDKGKGEVECKNSAPNSSKTPTSWKPGAPFASNTVKTSGENQNANQGTGLSKSNPTSKGISLNNNKSVASSTQELGQKMTGVVTEGKSNNAHVTTQKGTTSWRPGFPFPPMSLKTSGMIQSPNPNHGMISNLKKSSSNAQEVDQKFLGSMRSNPFVAAKVFGASSTARATLTSAPLAHVQSSQSGQYQTTSSSSEANDAGKCNEGRGSDPDRGR